MRSFVKRWRIRESVAFVGQAHISLEKAPSVLLIHGDKIRMGARKTTGGLTLSGGGCCVRGAGILNKTSSASSSVHSSQSQRRRKGQTGVGVGGGVHHLGDTVKSERRGDKLKIGS